MEREGDVVAKQLEEGIIQQMRDVLAQAGEEIVHAEHMAIPRQQPLAEMGTDEAGPPCY
jgi:hypothetical protein